MVVVGSSGDTNGGISASPPFFYTQSGIIGEVVVVVV